ncbi:MAG: two-component hybrid sensor and regulator [Proteobacteria bacterium]|nr:MAG: two-component hybrid sensor and regulator [Pseudomonadota bacterium]
MSDVQPAAILVVDDRREQRISLAALLGELGEEVVTASSGRDALRCLLQRDFALILLDVNMPDMDGFETASLIRQRKRTEHTPIIFVTAYGDDTYASRGYSLGAVDYILAPVDPQILKTKVQVFLDLYRKTEEASRHAELLKRQAAQLRRLTDAAIAIHAASSLDELLKLVADTAATVANAQQVAVGIDTPAIGDSAALGRRERHAVLRPENTALELLAHAALADVPARAVRMGRDELEGHPRWGAIGRDDGALPLRGWLAAPLSSRDGHPMGWIQLSEKRSGDFTAEDETLLVQLAQMAAIAAENTFFKEVREASRVKDQFLATLSHELRTPLQAILSWSSMLRDNPSDGTLVARGLEVIERNARSQTRLIEDLLDVSRIVSGKLAIDRSALRLGDVVEASVEDARPAARDKQIEIEIERLDEAWIAGDNDRLRQVMGNLFSNAIKFTPAGGRVWLGVASDGCEAEVWMRDTGVGVASEFLPHLFERFRQADGGMRRSHGGLGIGLAVVRHLVELHGGSVRAASDGEGQGTGFYLRFPLAGSAPSEHGLAFEQAAERALGVPARLDGLRVLLVDDDADTRECLAVALRECGASVRAVASVREALQALDRHRADVLLSDLAMPEEDGYSLIRRVRARPEAEGGRIPAAALSAHVRPQERARALLAGFDMHLSKPIEPADLAAALRTMAPALDA